MQKYEKQQVVQRMILWLAALGLEALVDDPNIGPAVEKMSPTQRYLFDAFFKIHDQVGGKASLSRPFRIVRALVEGDAGGLPLADDVMQEILRVVKDTNQRLCSPRRVPAGEGVKESTNKDDTEQSSEEHEVRRLLGLPENRARLAPAKGRVKGRALPEHVRAFLWAMAPKGNPDFDLLAQDFRKTYEGEEKPPPCSAKAMYRWARGSRVPSDLPKFYRWLLPKVREFASEGRQPRSSEVGGPFERVQAALQSPVGMQVLRLLEQHENSLLHLPWGDEAGDTALPLLVRRGIYTLRNGFQQKSLLLSFKKNGLPFSQSSFSQWVHGGRTPAQPSLMFEVLLSELKTFFQKQGTA